MARSSHGTRHARKQEYCRTRRHAKHARSQRLDLAGLPRASLRSSSRHASRCTIPRRCHACRTGQTHWAGICQQEPSICTRRGPLGTGRESGCFPFCLDPTQQLLSFRIRLDGLGPTRFRHGPDPRDRRRSSSGSWCLPGTHTPTPPRWADDRSGLLSRSAICKKRWHRSTKCRPPGGSFRPSRPGCAMDEMMLTQSVVHLPNSPMTACRRFHSPSCIVSVRPSTS